MLNTPLPVGTGVNRADLVIEFGDGALYTFAVAFGAAPSDTITGLALFDIVEAETALTTIRQDFGFGIFIDGIFFDGHGDAGYGGGDNWWHYWTRESGAADWVESAVGVGQRLVSDGDADGWVYGRSGPPVPEPGTLALLLLGGVLTQRRRERRKREWGWVRLGFCVVGIPAFGVSSVLAVDPWADQVADFSPTLNGSGLYNDPQSVLGMPATTYWDDTVGQQFVVSLVAGAFNRDAPNGHKLITTLYSGQFIKVRFDEPVEDDPRNPFGIDLLVFGNAAFLGNGFVTPATDMGTYLLTGGVLAEPVTVAVSSNGIGNPQTHPQNWYVYQQGPFADDLFPTHAYAWNRMAHAWGAPLDFTRPVDPALTFDDFVGITAADGIDRYDGSGGGTGFDLGESGFAEINFLYLTSAGGEVDALADVFPALGDFDRDGDLDLWDFAVFQRCFGKTDGDPVWAECRDADFDGDRAVEPADYARFAAFLSGPQTRNGEWRMENEGTARRVPREKGQ